MKVGVIGSFYNCAELLPKVLAPWVELKQQGTPLVLTAVHAQFKEYAELGYKNEDEQTLAVLQEYASHFDLLHIDEKPLTEAAVRNIGLEFLLEQKVDLVWILDGDEIYTKEQIEGILEYIAQTPHFPYYHLYFNNRVFDMPLKDVFAPPRIFRTDRRGGIKEFIEDNMLEYNDGTQPYNLIPGFVPRRIAHILHYTWRKKDAVDKINYHRKHFGFCPFTYDAGTQTFSFDPTYFEIQKQPFPKISEDYIELIPLKPVTIIVDLKKQNQEAVNASVTKALDALLCIERENSYELHLTVLVEQKFIKGLSEFLKLAPFEYEVKEEVPAETQRKLVYLAQKDMVQEFGDLLKQLRTELSSEPAPTTPAN